MCDKYSIDEIKENLFGEISDDELALLKSLEDNSNAENENKIKFPISFYNNMITFNPYQYKPYFKLMSKENKYKCVYIADEVGVGKTFETGIIISEMLYNKSVRNVVIVCPNMLAQKWQMVLDKSFGLANTIIKDVKNINNNRISIVSFDTISRMENVDDIKEIGLLIIDEAHNSSGKRFNNIYQLRLKCVYAVLVSATPIAGKGNSDENQKKLLFGENDAIAFSFTQESVYLNRTLKDELRDNKDVKWTVRNIEYVNENFEDYVAIANEIFRGKNTLRKFEGLNMLSSSNAAGKIYIEKLKKYDEIELQNFIDSSYSENEYDEDDDYFDEKNEPKEELSANKIKELIDKITFSDNEDNKLEALKGIIEKNKSIFDEKAEYYEYYKKIIVFTNYNDTANYLNEQIKNSILINGEINQLEKLKRFNKFKDENSDTDVLIITNVAAEGQDMDFSNTLVNYDLHYNPVFLAQRKGRIDRFEVKKKDHFIYNFAIAGFDGIEKSDSIYSVINRKLISIYNQTSIFYDVIGTESPKDENAAPIEQNKPILGVFSEYFGENFVDKESIYTFVKDNVNCTELANQFLKEKGLEIEFDSDSVIIKTSKQNKEFLNKVFYGGTLNSHLIYSQEG